MKEKLNKAKECIKENKKRSAGIAVAVLLIIGATGIGLAGVNSVNVSKDADKVTAEKDTSKKTVKKGSDSKKTSDSDKKKKEAASDQEKKADDAKAENDSVAADQKKADDGKQTAENNSVTSTSNAGASNQADSSSSSSGGGSSQESSHTHSCTIPVYGTEQKWVVDQSALTETFNEPIYEMQERSICNVCGADITGNTAAHAKEHALAGEGGGHHSEWIQVQTGTNTYTIEHPEQGHWESYSVVTGYRCSCGYAQ